MSRPLYIGIIVANLLLVLAVVNGAILKKQAVVESGERVVLKLAPVDPRSLMQGDYMILSYALGRDDQFREAATETRGRVYLKRDDKDVGTFASVEEGEVYLNYRKWRRGYRFGIESFFFEEGMAEVFEDAEYAELRVGPKGDAVIVDLMDADWNRLSD
ncbi:MAG: GDYXXLXY domain-containing protein [Verrucomicrobiales bacterium]|nr:GDYXXLXY domain-containing protein [Verrucomicrobiales bacterium]